MEKQTVKTQRKLHPVAQRAVNAATVAAGAVLVSAPAMAEDIALPASVGVAGLAAASAGVFAIKAAPQFIMWGYGKLLGFIRR